jgi:2-keto-myo-inositol isomerase
MTLLLNTVTIRQAPLAERFRLAASSGYEGLEIWGDELDEVADGVAYVRTLAAQHRMPIIGVCPHRSLYTWHHAWDAVMQRAFQTQLERYAAIGAKYLVLPVLSDEGTLEHTAASLRAIAPMAERLGMIAALEPIGHVGKLSSFDDAADLLSAVSGIGLIADVFHFFRGGNRLDDLARLDPARITAVHLNDAINLPLEELVGYRHRVYPAHGIFDVVGFCIALRRQGYHGPYVVELLNPSYWEEDPVTVSDTAWRACRTVLDAAMRGATCP